MSKAGTRLLRAADEMLAIARGEATPAHVHVPHDVDAKAIRAHSKVTMVYLKWINWGKIAISFGK
jgi:hypothetical protein